MADQANVYVRNSLGQAIEVIREQPDKTRDVHNLTVGQEESIFLSDSNVNLIINAPGGEMGIPMIVKSTGGVKISCSVLKRAWTIRTEPTDSETVDTPTTVNVNLGEEDD